MHMPTLFHRAVRHYAKVTSAQDAQKQAYRMATIACRMPGCIGTVSVVTALYVWLNSMTPQPLPPFTLYFFTLLFITWFGDRPAAFASLALMLLTADYFFVSPTHVVSLIQQSEGIFLLGGFAIEGVVSIFLVDYTRTRFRREYARQNLPLTARRKLVLDSMPSMVWMSDREGNFSFTNRRWNMYFQKTAGEMRRIGWVDMLHPNDIHQFKKLYLAASSKQEDFSTEVRLRRSSHSVRWFVISGTHTVSVEGKPQMLGTCVDIHRKKTEELKRGEYLSVVSHELRTPLAAIRGFSHLLEKRMSNRKDVADDTDTQYLQRLSSNVERMNTYIDDLLEVSSGKRSALAVRTRKVALTPLIQEVVGLIGNERVQVGKLQKSLFAEGDPERITQVLSNFIMNALKYSPSTGRVYVSCAGDKQYAYVQVKDNGPGIPKKQQKKIFEPYRQLENASDSPKNGVGLGLFIAKTIAKKHRGAIDVHSEPGTTVVTFRLKRIVGRTG